jgi:endonuclease/exonuclease/phosphatase family metal-dependent hydrolase
MKSKLVLALICLTLVASSLRAQSTGSFVVAAYNVENWNQIERRGKPDQPKPQIEKDAVVAVIATVRPDVLALEEMGKTNDLAELVAMLRAKGVDYANQEWIESFDPDRHVSLLSRFPIAQRFSRIDYNYLLDGKPTRIQRGILDVLVKVNDHYSFRAIVAHLKSKRASDIGDQALMRLEEARLLRAHIGKILKDNPRQNLIAMGDFNDTPESEPIRTLVGEPPFALLALRPLDSKAGDGTQFWRARQEFSRIDYLIASPGMSNEYIAGSARIADVEGWDKASDHRMVHASFHDRDIGEPVAQQARVPNRIATVALLVAVIAGAVVVVLTSCRPKSPVSG